MAKAGRQAGRCQLVKIKGPNRKYNLCLVWFLFVTFHHFSAALSIRDVLKTEDELKEAGARSDLLRYEVVHQYGGIYMDTDSISVKGLDAAFTQSFVVYSLSPWNNLQNSIFGMPKGDQDPFNKIMLH